MTISIKDRFGNEIEERIEELMREGKESPIRGWSARDICKTITKEFIWEVDDEDKADVIEMYAFNYIRELCGVK
tara:strand:- start:408 stop:629 length:222 start_codon:yes stop_codon:yes gene_type:complete